MSELDDDLARLRKAWLDFAYTVLKAVGVVALVRRAGMEPKAWVRDREDAHGR
jgi:hypothetical protein